MDGYGLSVLCLLVLSAFYFGHVFTVELPGSGIVVTVTEHGQPRPHDIAPRASLTLRNSDITLDLVCSAPFPVEWVYENERAAAVAAEGTSSPLANLNNDLRGAYANRRLHPTPALFQAIMFTRYKNLDENDQFECRSVTFSNKSSSDTHNTSVLVTLLPNLTHIHVTQENKAELTLNGHDRADRDDGDDGATCNINFFVAVTEMGHYWRCEDGGGRARNKGTEGGQIRFYNCGTGGDCANTFRRSRVSTSKCVTLHRNWKYVDVLMNGKWELMEGVHHRPGVAVCRMPGDAGSHSGSGSVEYFFGGSTWKSLYFSVDEAPPEDLIWLNPPPRPSPTPYYVHPAEKLTTACTASLYNIATGGDIQVRLNGSLLAGLPRNERVVEDETKGSLWTTAITLDFVALGVGRYEITCFAPLWRSEGFTNLSRVIEVRHVVKPDFEIGPRGRTPTDVQIMTFNEGETNARLVCHPVKGDPSPDTEFMTWATDDSDFSEIQTQRGPELLIPRVTKEYNGTSVGCKATNRFGSFAIRTFKINVKKAPETSRSESSGSESSTTEMSPTTIALISVGVIVVVLFGAAFTFLYCKFLRFGRAIVNYLTEEEENVFRNGKSVASTSSRPKSVANDYVSLPVDNLPYNSDYEVPREQFIVDLKRELGSGQYGVVYKGYIMKFEDETARGSPNSITVAVKTVRPNVPIEYFKALLSELKILAYIGRHDHIANLIGACSANIKSRELYVGVELCAGSLLKLLRDNRHKFIDKLLIEGEREPFIQETSFTNEYVNQSAGAGSMSTFDLIRWAAEIADGMEFLASKRVVHADLAARNVLVSFDLRAKICDFGLARQLVDYSYIKKQVCSLPWKWMAIESLAHMQFTSASDVWAYGVTCWEIFSLGAVPYPCLAWSWDFVDQLVNGQRLTPPANASGPIYDKMLKCWEEIKEDRPTFTELKTFFQEQQSQE